MSADFGAPPPLSTSFIELWSRARLRANQSNRRSTATTSPLMRALLFAAGVGNKEGVGVRCRATPSAGALYPFNTVGFLPCERAHAGFLVDCKSGGLRALGTLVSISSLRTVLSSCAAQELDEKTILLIVAVRPWASMVKYGARGYFYSLLDAGHAVANLALLLSRDNRSITVDCHFNRVAMRSLLGLEAWCQDPVAVVLVNGETDFPELAGTISAVPDSEEVGFWARLARDGLVGVSYAAAKLAPGCGIGLPGVPSCRGVSTGLNEEVPLFAYASWRHSASGFMEIPVPLETIARVIGRAKINVHQTWGDHPLELTVRLVRREGSDGYSFYDVIDGELKHVATEPTAPEAMLDWGHACMHQSFVQRASVLVVVYCRALDWSTTEAASELCHLHLRAGYWMQGLYLAAAASGVGITALGGFDAELCRAIARLNPTADVIYVSALGFEDPLAVKADRSNVAESHGFTRRFTGIGAGTIP